MAAAVFAAGFDHTRTSPISGYRRGPYCMMGVCFECLVEIDGDSQPAGLHDAGEGGHAHQDSRKGPEASTHESILRLCHHRRGSGRAFGCGTCRLTRVCRWSCWTSSITPEDKSDRAIEQEGEERLAALGPITVHGHGLVARFRRSKSRLPRRRNGLANYAGPRDLLSPKRPSGMHTGRAPVWLRPEPLRDQSRYQAGPFRVLWERAHVDVLFKSSGLVPRGQGPWCSLERAHCFT